MLFRLQTIAAGLDGSDGGGGAWRCHGIVGGPLARRSNAQRRIISTPPRRSMTPPAEEVHTYAQERAVAAAAGSWQRQAPGRAQSGVDESEQEMQDVPVALPRRRSRSNSTARLPRFSGATQRASPHSGRCCRLVSSQSGACGRTGRSCVQTCVRRVQSWYFGAARYRSSRLCGGAPHRRAHAFPLVPAVKGDRKKTTARGCRKHRNRAKSRAGKVRAQWRQWHTTRRKTRTSYC